MAGPLRTSGGRRATADGAAREGAEEIGVRVDPSALQLVHFIDHRAPDEPPRLGVFYRAHA